MRIPGLDEQGVFQEVNISPGQQEDKNEQKVIGDGLKFMEERGGRQTRQGLDTMLRIWIPSLEGQSLSSPGFVCLLGNLTNDQSV